MQVLMEVKELVKWAKLGSWRMMGLGLMVERVKLEVVLLGELMQGLKQELMVGQVMLGLFLLKELKLELGLELTVKLEVFLQEVEFEQEQTILVQELMQELFQQEQVMEVFTQLEQVMELFLPVLVMVVSIQLELVMELFLQVLVMVVSIQLVQLMLVHPMREFAQQVYFNSASSYFLQHPYYVVSTLRSNVIDQWLDVSPFEQPLFYFHAFTSTQLDKKHLSSAF